MGLRTLTAFVLAAVLGGLLTSCGTPADKKRLAGERLSVSGEGTAIDDPSGGTPPPLRLGAARRNQSWTHLGGNAQHQAGHVALGPEVGAAWSVRVGAKQTNRNRSISTPIVSGQRIFTIDAEATVTAVSTEGAVLWTTNLAPLSDAAGQGTSGGLATDGQTLFATTGFGDLVALDLQDGSEIWSQDLEGFGGTAPTVFGDYVYLSARGGAAWAVEKSNGRILWQIAGAEPVSGFLGGAGPAVNDAFALFPFATGEVLSVYRKGGLRNWTTVLSGNKLGRAISAYSDLTGDPVIVGDTVYVGNSAGRIMALDLLNGDRLWTAPQGVSDMIAAAGGSLFFVNEENRLLRVSAATGSVLWSKDLPRFKTDKPKRRKGSFAHFGPVLAGGRLVVPSSDGTVRFFDAETGNLTHTVPIKGGASAPPAVANGTLYVMSTTGLLHAYR